MKVTFHKNIAAYSGKDKWQQCIYSATLNGTACTVRRYIKPRETEQQTIFGEGSKNIADLWSIAKQPFKEDMSIYSWAVKNTKGFEGRYMTSSYGWFVVVCWKVSEKESIEINNLSIDDFVENGLDSVKALINSGYLIKVDNADDLTNNIN